MRAYIEKSINDKNALKLWKRLTAKYFRRINGIIFFRSNFFYRCKQFLLICERAGSMALFSWCSPSRRMFQNQDYRAFQVFGCPQLYQIVRWSEKHSQLSWICGPWEVIKGWETAHRVSMLVHPVHQQHAEKSEIVGSSEPRRRWRLFRVCTCFSRQHPLRAGR